VNEPHLHLNLHLHPPMTLRRIEARLGWVVPVAALLFVLLAVGAAADLLPWDEPITEAAIDARTDDRNDAARQVSWLGSTPVVLAVAGSAAVASWRRCPRLAMAIVVLALARPLTEWALKELIGRERPIGSRLVRVTGPSFPSGHPFATAASWGFLPLVVALYTRRRALWWGVAVSVWVLATLVAASRVWLGVHWTSDVVGGLLLALLGVAVAERVVAHTHE